MPGLILKQARPCHCLYMLQTLLHGTPHCMAPAHFLDLAFAFAFALPWADGALVPSDLTPCCCRGFSGFPLVEKLARLLAQKNMGLSSNMLLRLLLSYRRDLTVGTRKTQACYIGCLSGGRHDLPALGSHMVWEVHAYKWDMFVLYIICHASIHSYNNI